MENQNSEIEAIPPNPHTLTTVESKQAEQAVPPSAPPPYDYEYATAVMMDDGCPNDVAK